MTVLSYDQQRHIGSCSKFCNKARIGPLSHSQMAVHSSQLKLVRLQAQTEFLLSETAVEVVALQWTAHSQTARWLRMELNVPSELQQKFRGSENYSCLDTTSASQCLFLLSLVLSAVYGM